MKVINIRKDNESRGACIRLEGLQSEIHVTYSDGELELLPPLYLDFVKFAELIQQAFEGENDILVKTEEYFEAEILSMSFRFNDIRIIVTAENSNWYDMLKEYTIGMERAKYPKSFAVELDAETEMLYKNETAREHWKKAVKSAKSMTTLNVARRWAKMMQFYMSEEHQKLEDIVEKAYEEAMLDQDTGSTRTFATNALLQCWKYSAELKEYLSTKKEKRA